MKRFVLMFAAFGLLFACTPEGNNSSETDKPGGGSTGPEQTSSVTVGTESLSAISVVLKGKANLGSTVASDLKVGFQYSKSAGILPTNSTTVDAEDADANYNFTTGITELEPATTYYFRSFVRQNGQDTYGETKSFTMKDIASLLETNEASDVEATKATLNAKLDLTDVQYKSLAYGFLWGSSEAALNMDFRCTEIKDNAIAAILTSLSHKTQYWYKAYVELDSQTFYGVVKAFTTDVVPVESVSLDNTEYTFHTIGNTLMLKATVLPSEATDKSIEWSSNKEDIATVDQTGKITAKGNGKATITVTTKDQGKTASCEVTVAQWVTSISLNQTSLTLNEGQTANLSVSAIAPDNANDKSVTWSSSDESVATVDSDGKVTAVSKGTAAITATANDGGGKQVTCAVNVNRLVSIIQLDKTTLTIFRGADDVTETITATVTPSSANNTTVTWKSSNSSVADVSSSGVVAGKNRGTATITVTANDDSGVTATCEVEVKQYVTSITLSKTSLSLLVGAEENISVTSVQPENANDKTYTWSSSDNAIATVDQNGKITAKARGEVVIKATPNDGSEVCAECGVIITTKAVDLGLPSGVKWASFNVGASVPEEYGYFYAWGETETKSNYYWDSYKWCNGSSKSLTKYNSFSGWGTVYNKTVLDSEDDVAHVNLGGGWRMPTDADWTELRDNCSWTWTDNYNRTGIKGRIVTSNIEGYKDRSIFLPAAGWWDNAYYFDGSVDGVPCGYYWSSTRCDSSDRAYGLGIEPDFVKRTTLPRYKGFSVRPVSE